jgi:ethanolamine utilization protein EutA
LYPNIAVKFAALRAGERLDTTLVAYGSGAVQLSAREALRVMHVDIGGGTAKIAVCERGEIVDRTVIDVGARLIAFDADDRVTLLEDAGREFAAEAGIDLQLGGALPLAARQQIVERMAEHLIHTMTVTPLQPGTFQSLRMAPLVAGPTPDIVSFSGGVSEYLSNKESQTYGDLGPLLAGAIMRRMHSWGIPVREPTAGIRATVIGASQYTVQLSGSTIFVTPPTALPLRNLTVVRPRLASHMDGVDSIAIAGEIRLALEHLDLADGERPVAIFFPWQGSASYQRLDAFCRGLLSGLELNIVQGHPLVLATDADVGGLLGMHLKHECGVEIPIVSVDGLNLSELDFIDIGSLLESTGAVPVVIKSLVFPAATPSAA